MVARVYMPTLVTGVVIMWTIDNRQPIEYPNPLQTSNLQPYIASTGTAYRHYIDIILSI